MTTPIRRWIEENLSESERRVYKQAGYEVWTSANTTDRLRVAVAQEIIVWEAERDAAEARVLDALEADHRAEVQRIADALDLPTPPWHDDGGEP